MVLLKQVGSRVPLLNLRHAIQTPSRVCRRQFSLRPSRIKAALISTKDSFRIDNGPPGIVIGTVNDAYVHPEPDYVHGSYHWTYERIIGVSLVPLTIAPFTVGLDMPLLELLLGTLLTVHSYYGFQSCIIDYIPKRRFRGWHTLAMRTLKFGSCVALYGLYELETDGSGLFELSRQTWASLSSTEHQSWSY